MSVLMVVRIAFKALSRNKLRTALTMLGMIIGVSAVITMVALGSGAQASIDAQIQSLQRPRAEKDHVVRFGEHHFVNRLRPPSVHDGIPDVAMDGTTIGGPKAECFLARDAERLQRSARRPRELRAGVDERLRQRMPDSAPKRVFDLDCRSKRSHVRHDSPPCRKCWYRLRS